jgi:hypothetical protein
MQPKPRDVRDARKYLQTKGLRTSDMNPRDFAAAAAEAGKRFGETLRLVAALQMGTQGRGPAPIGEAIARENAKRGKA